MPLNPGPLIESDCVQWAPPSVVAYTVEASGFATPAAKQTLVVGQLMASNVAG
jgi:hypothetical protein